MGFYVIDNRSRPFYMGDALVSTSTVRAGVYCTVYSCHLAFAVVGTDCISFIGALVRLRSRAGAGEYRFFSSVLFAHRTSHVSRWNRFVWFVFPRRNMDQLPVEWTLCHVGRCFAAWSGSFSGYGNPRCGSRIIGVQRGALCYRTRHGILKRFWRGDRGRAVKYGITNCRNAHRDNDADGSVCPCDVDRCSFEKSLVVNDKCHSCSGILSNVIFRLPDCEPDEGEMPRSGGGVE